MKQALLRIETLIIEEVDALFTIIAGGDVQCL